MFSLTRSQAGNTKVPPPVVRAETLVVLSLLQKLTQGTGNVTSLMGKESELVHKV